MPGKNLPRNLIWEKVNVLTRFVEKYQKHIFEKKWEKCENIQQKIQKPFPGSFRVLSGSISGKIETVLNKLCYKNLYW